MNSKNQHPQLRLIPQAIWVELFQDYFHKNIIDWMKISDAKLKGPLPLLPSKIKDMVWVAIIFNHPALNDQQLIEIGERLGLSQSEMLNLAVMLGDDAQSLGLVNTLIQKESFIEADAYS